MKKISLFLFLFSTLGWANPETVERVLKDTTTLITLKLDEGSVFCTDRGYGNVQLKVSVPDLEWLAHFDHRVVGERLPCITGGRCSESLSPGKFIDNGQKFAIVPIQVVLFQVLTIDKEKKTCESRIEERIFSTIKDHRFSHFRSGNEQSMEFEKCLSDAHL